jgi:uncharacterized protein
LLTILQDYFAQREDIAFAFLFGSQAKGTVSSLSDVDVAVYFFPAIRHPIEFEEQKVYPGEEQIWNDLERMLGKEVDLVVLNRVPATVASSALRGIPLLIKDWGLYLDFLLAVTDESEKIMSSVIGDYLRDQFGKRDPISID